METGCVGDNPAAPTPTPSPINTLPPPATNPPPTNEVTKIQRTYYSIAGQMVGVRVKKIRTNGSTESDSLYYMYTDHLGNVGALSDKNGTYISGSLTLFRPFGDFRRTPSTNPGITDRGYTGHAHHNSGSNDLGLIYMRARFYLPEAGRFISADTLVPDPMNPQQFNRYTYSLNSPLKYSDPTGHIACAGEEPSLCSDDAWKSFNDYSHWMWVGGLGYIDRYHVNRGYDRGAEALKEVTKVYNGDTNGALLVDAQYGFNIQYTFYGDFSSAQIPYYAASIAMDYEYQFEQFQVDSGLPTSLSGYSIEDLPSDYIGIWAAVNGFSKDQIFYILKANQGGIYELQSDVKVFGEPLPLPLHYLTVGRVIDSNGNGSFSFPTKNYEYMPLVPTSFTDWTARPWPSYLQVDHTTLR